MIKNWTDLYNRKSYFRIIKTQSIVVNHLKKKLIYSNVAKDLFYLMNPFKNKKISNYCLNNYFKFLYKHLNIKKNEEILDFGSGNGWLLSNLRSKFSENKFYSLDVSKPFINSQKKILRNCNFQIINPNNTKIYLGDKSVCWTISNAVFHCLPNRTHAKKIIFEMLRISKKGILITNISDEKFKKNFFNRKLKTEKISKKEFKKKYQHTKHLFFEKKYFKFLNKKKVNFKILKMPKNSTFDSNFKFALKIIN